MRILHINLSAAVGGGPEHLYQLVKGMLETDMQCFIATPFNSPNMERFTSLVEKKQMFNMPERQFSLRYLFRLIKFAQENNIDILHSHGKGAGVYSRLVSMLVGIKCIHTFHGLHINYSFFLKHMYILLERTLSHFTACCIAVSASEFNKALALKLASSKCLVMICNGVAVSDDPPVLCSRNDETFKIIQMSRFDVAKNSKLVLDIAQNLRCKNKLYGVKIIFLGDGEERADIEKQVKAEGLEEYVSFAGISNSPRSFLRESHCYLSTSLWEGMPLALLEAMSEGLPAIASDVVGNRDAVLAGETGFLFPLDNPCAAADYISILLEQPQLCAKFGLAAYRRVQDCFDVRRMVSETRDLYLKILRSPR